jgi:hypothetical protein
LRAPAIIPALVLLALACGDGRTNPAAPAPAAPAPTAASPAPSVIAMTPAVGSTGGATRVRLTGAGFEYAGHKTPLAMGVVVTIGGTAVPARVDFRDPVGTVLYLDTPAHAAGPVDVVVTKPDGQKATLAGGYTYAAPESFDFSGTWLGFDVVGVHLGVEFTIRDGALLSVQCDFEAPLTFSDPPAVRDGAFSYASEDGSEAVSGRIVSASQAVGVIKLGACAGLPWGATRQ